MVDSVDRRNGLSCQAYKVMIVFLINFHLLQGSSLATSVPQMSFLTKLHTWGQ